jgi:predicted RND superfamily exporter protein
MQVQMRKSVQGLLKWMAHVIVAIDVALLLAAAVNVGQMSIVNNAIDIWFDLADPTLRTLNRERGLFGTDTWMLATVWLRADRVNDEAADVIRGLTRDLEQIGNVTRVLSPTSLEVLQRNEQGLFFDGIDAETGWMELRERLLKHPIARNFLVYEQSPEMFSVVIKENSIPSTAGTTRQRLVAEVRRVLDGDPAVAASALSGAAVINADLNRLSWGDFIVLIPATFILASLVLLVVIGFRWRATLAIMTPVCLAAVGLVTAMLLSGHALTMITIALPGLIFTLGIASSLHVTGWIANWLREGRGSAGEAAQATMRQLLRPMLVSQITTALGFGALVVVQVRPVQEMALFGAAGVVYSALHVLFVLPKCLYWFGAMEELGGPRPLFAGSRWSGSRLEGLVDGLRRIQRWRYWILAPTAAVCVGIVWLISLVVYDSTYLNMVDEGERLRRDYARFDAAGLPSAELSVLIWRSGDSGIVDAGLNAAIGSATAEIEALPGVSKVVGPAGIFAEVAPALAGDEALESFAADDAAVTDAYIFALSGGNTEVGSYVHDGLDAYRLVVFFPYVENSRLQELAREIAAILDTHFRNMQQVTTEVSGLTVLWANMDDAISRGQMASLLFMAATCFISFLVSLRDWHLAASSTLVNVMPVGMVGALLGATGQPIDMATVFIMGIALGIADDDTSFFVHECLERQRQGEKALTATLRQNGPKMVATCIVIVIGFTMLLTSSFMPMRTFGGLTALGLVLAMLCDVFLLPFLLVAFPGKRKQNHHATNKEIEDATGNVVGACVSRDSGAGS